MVLIIYMDTLFPFSCLFFSEEGFCWDDFLPHLGLLVSGGNTLLFELDTFLNLNILSETVDDAAGEALDKGAKASWNSTQEVQSWKL